MEEISLHRESAVTPDQLENYKVYLKLPESVKAECWDLSNNPDVQYTRPERQRGPKNPMGMYENGTQIGIKTPPDMLDFMHNFVGVETTRSLITIINPTVRIHPHIHYARETTDKSWLTWAISDPKLLAPTEFYDSEPFPGVVVALDKVTISAEAHWDDYAFIIECRKLHGVPGRPDRRVMFHMVYDIEPPELKNIINKHCGIQV